MTQAIPSLSATGLVLLLAVASPAWAEGEGELPAEQCVRQMRSARIAGMHGAAAAELEKLEAAADACPGEIAPIYALMSFHRRQPHREESYRALLDRLQRRLRAPDYDLPIGIIEYVIRNPDAEEDELVEVLENIARQVDGSETPDPHLMRILAQLQLRLGRLDDAIETIERLWRLTASKDLVQTLYMLYARLENWQEAARLLEPLIEEDPRLRYSYIHVLGKLGRTGEVLEQLRIFSQTPGPKSDAPAGTDQNVPTGTDVQVDPTSAEVPVVFATLQRRFDPLLRQVAWDLRDRGQDAEAERIFRGLLERSPDDPSLQAIVLHLYASAEEQQGHAEALADKWATETDPNALFEGGTQKLTAGDAAGAIDLLRRAAPEFPDLEAAWYNLGMAAYKLEEWATVDSAFQRAGEINPSRAESFFFRGIALVKLKRCGDAVPALERAVEIDPGRTLSHYYLAVCYRQLGDREAAVAARKRYDASQQ